MNTSHEIASIYEPIAELHSTASESEAPQIRTAGEDSASSDHRSQPSRRQTAPVEPSHSFAEAVAVALIHAGIWCWFAWCLW
jgi:hypothetical protein